MAQQLVTSIIRAVSGMEDDGTVHHFIGVSPAYVIHTFRCTNSHCELGPDDLHAPFTIKPDMRRVRFLVEAALHGERVDETQMCLWVNQRGYPRDEEASCIVTLGSHVIHILLMESLYGELIETPTPTLH